MYRTRKGGKWGSWLPIMYSTEGLRIKLSKLIIKGEIDDFEIK